MDYYKKTNSWSYILETLVIFLLLVLYLKIINDVMIKWKTHIITTFIFLHILNSIRKLFMLLGIHGGNH
jgi:hypothetical protein